MNTETNKMIYINSINKEISLEEFKSLYYKEGHVYRISPEYFHRCIGFNEYGPLVETVSVQIHSNGYYGINIHPATPYSMMPSLDFVNKVLAGEITEVDPIAFNDMVCTIINYANIINEISKNLK